MSDEVGWCLVVGIYSMYSFCSK